MEAGGGVLAVVLRAELQELGAKLGEPAVHLLVVDEVEGAELLHEAIEAVQGLLIDRPRLETAIDLLGAATRGMLADNVAANAFDHLDQWDAKAWLSRHGASKASLASGLMAAAEGLAVGYPGPGHAGELSAAVFLKGLCRLAFGAQDALFYKLQAGAGDTVFAPLYQVLAARGVQFRFFHAVTGLQLTADQTAVAAVSMVRQAELAGDYNPLTMVRNVPAWPSAPLWEQLADGDDLRAAAADFEDESRAPAGTPFMLERGLDFDEVILGIGIGALPSITGELAAASGDWANMLEQVQTSAIVKAQVWLTVPSAEYGWKQLVDEHNPEKPSGNRPLDTMAAGLNGCFQTWTDVSDLLARADWGWDDRPWSAAAFSALAEDEAVSPTTETLLGWMDTELGLFWPHMKDGQGGFLYSVLHDPERRQGSARLEWQFVHHGATGSQRHTLSLPGNLAYRLPPGKSGFANLYLAGDWTRNGVDTASMESAAVSGYQAAAAVSGKA